jgi:hypothetical protein
MRRHRRRGRRRRRKRPTRRARIQRVSRRSTVVGEPLSIVFDLLKRAEMFDRTGSEDHGVVDAKLCQGGKRSDGLGARRFV